MKFWPTTICLACLIVQALFVNARIAALEKHRDATLRIAELQTQELSNYQQMIARVESEQRILKATISVMIDTSKIQTQELKALQEKRATNWQ